MLAAMRSDVVEFVVYEGFGDHYPQWFVDRVTEFITYDEEYECAVFSGYGLEPMVLIEGDVILYNKFGNLYHLEREKFSQLMYEVDCWDSEKLGAAQKGDVLEFVFYNGSHEHYPDWFTKRVGVAILSDSDDVATLLERSVMTHIEGIKYSNHGTFDIRDGDAFLLNKKGRIKYLDGDTFADNFYVVE